MKDATELALVGGAIIDGNGGIPIQDGVLLISGERITAVGDRSTPIPSHARQISATGKFIIPGLIGDVTFLVFDAVGVATLVRYEGRYDELALEAAQVALKSGLTTVFDLFGPRDDLIKVRTTINEGKAVGPRIHLCGGWVGCNGPFSADNHNNWGQALQGDIAARINAQWECNVAEGLTSMSPAQVRTEVRKYIEAGIDFLTVMVNVHRYGNQRFFQFSPRVLSTIVDEAHRANLVVRGHCMYSEEGVWTAVNAGVDLPFMVYMSTPLSVETVDLLAKRQIPWHFNPFTRAELDWFRQRLKVDDLAHGTVDSEWARANEFLVKEKPVNERAVVRAGVPVMLSTGGYLLSEDSWKSVRRSARIPPGDFGILGKNHFNMLLAAQEMGMKPMEILQSATRNIARGYNVDRDLGTLEPGKLADLLILDRNPLADVGNYSSISVVMKGGGIIDRDTLPTKRLLTAPAMQAT